jgi:shikimate dehydrogenase
MQITGKTQLLGIIGNPIEHSLSPVIQNKAIDVLGLDYVYIPFCVAEKDLKSVFDGFQAINLKGFNVTIPHKQNVIPLLHHITDTAKMIGAVNTVWLTEEGWHGTNTDIDGFIAPLKKLAKNWLEITPLILGHGGASRAVIVGCQQLGCKKINVVGRNLDKLKAFEESWQKTPLNSEIVIHEWDKLDDLIAESELIVNTTPIGMYPEIDNSPLTIAQSALIKPESIVYDLIYIPRPTLFLQQAKNQGAIIIDGSEMLVAQGAVGFSIWTGKPAPVEIMLNTLLSHLEN